MNPFLYGTIVRSNSFYDRNEECTRIINTLSGGNNIVLYAPRRYGKTSLVFRVIEQLEKAGYICVYFDMMSVFSLESFVKLYSKALSAKQSNLNKFAQMVSSIIKSIRPVLTFSDDGTPEMTIDFANTTVDEIMISQLLDIPEMMAGKNNRVMVFFDEFQEVKKLKEINFEGLLRSKIQQQQKTNYLFFGSKTHLLREMFNNKKKAFYNSASQMTIGSLPVDETINFLQVKFSQSNICIDDDTAKYLIKVAANIPYYIQFLASELWQNTITSDTIITKDMVDESVKKVIAIKSDFYMEHFEYRSQSQKQLLKALIYEGKNIYSAAYIKKYRLPAVGTLQRAVKKLMNDGIIDRKGKEYCISDPFFKMYLDKN